MTDLKSGRWNLPPIIAGMVSLLFSAWIYFVNDAINIDGVYFLEAANYAKSHAWVFRGGETRLIFSSVIAIFSMVTGLEHEISAYVLNAIFTATAVALLTHISYVLSGDNRIAFATAVLLLLNPHLNEYRAYVIRDPGYWALFSWGLLNFVRYQQTSLKIYAGFFGIAFFLAGLLRIEGFIFLVAAPLYFLFEQKKTILTRFRNFIWSYSVPLLALLLLLILFILGVDSITVHGMKHVDADNPLTGFISSFNQRADILNSAVFNGKSDKQAPMALLAALLMILIYKMVTVATPLYVLFTAHAIWGFWGVIWQKYMVVIWFSFINLIVLLVFVLHQNFLQGRYVVSLVFGLILIASHSLVTVYSKHQASYSSKQKKIVIGVSLWLLVLFIDGMWSFGIRKDYLREAGGWLKHNVKQDEEIHSNHPIVVYYAGRSTSDMPDGGWVIVSDEILEGQIPALVGSREGYLVVQLDKKRMRQHQQIVKSGKVTVKKEYNNKRGDRVIIYKLNKLDPYNVDCAAN